MDMHTLRRITLGLAVTIVLALAIVVAATQTTRAHEQAHRADTAEHGLASTTAELDAANATLSDTTGTLSSTKQRLTSVSRSLDRTKTQRNDLSHRMRACRYLVKVNDHLLYGQVAYQHATGRLLKRNPNMRAVKHDIQHAGRHAKAIIKLSKRGGYHNISGVVDACVPTRR